MRHWPPSYWSKWLHWGVLGLLPLSLFFYIGERQQEIRRQKLIHAVDYHNLALALEMERLGAPKEKETDLLLQMLKGNTAGVEALIAQGADVNANQSWGTPLFYAVDIGSLPMIKLLLKHGCRI